MIFNGLSLKQIKTFFLEGESPILREKKIDLDIFAPKYCGWFNTRL